MKVKITLTLILLIVSITAAFSQQQTNSFIVSTDQFVTKHADNDQLSPVENLPLQWVFNGQDSTVTIVFNATKKPVFKILTVILNDEKDGLMFKLLRADGTVVGLILYPKLKYLALGDSTILFIHHITSIKQIESSYTLKF